MFADRSFMEGKTCLVTGATSGIGAETAAALAAQGARVILVGRNPEKGQERLAQIRSTTGSDQLEFFQANLASQEEIYRLAEMFYKTHPALDVLVNNAGGVFMRRQYSPDRIEMTFALNHLSYFLLTHLLLDALKSAPKARIVNVSSAAHEYAQIAFDNLQGDRGYSGWAAYAQSKLANLLFTYELARRLKKTGITANALHPGFVATHFGSNNPGLPGWLLRLSRLGAISPAEGARTSVYLASAPQVEALTGKYFVRQKPVPSSPASYDETTAFLLWQISAEMTGAAVLA